MTKRLRIYLEYFDFDISDGLETLQKIKSAMDIPSKVSIGANYGTMIDKSL